MLYLSFYKRHSVYSFSISNLCFALVGHETCSMIKQLVTSVKIIDNEFMNARTIWSE